MFSYRKALVGAVLVGATAAGGALAATALTGNSSPSVASVDDTSSTVADTTATTAAPAADSTTTAADDTTADDSTADDSTTPPADADGDGDHAGKGPRDPSKGGHMANGITETLLTGDTAAKVTAAAEAAVPGGTIERVETDADGATYEAHMVKADGSHVTVTFNADFSVKEIQTGH